MTDDQPDHAPTRATAIAATAMRPVQWWFFLALILGGVIVAALFWPQWALVPQFGGDQAWQLGLSWAIVEGLEWGPDVVFTFGPLGFIDWPMAFSLPQVVTASLIHIASAIAAAWFTYRLLDDRWRLGRFAELGATLLIVAMAVYFAGALFAMLILGGLSLLVSRSWLAVAILGVGLGIAGQQKLSEAVLVLGFVTFCAVGGLGVRGLLGLGAVTAAAWLAVWVAAGQSLDQIVIWVERAVELSTGYGLGLGKEEPGTAWHYVVAALVIVLIVGLTSVVARSLDRRQRILLFAAVAWALWLTWNAAFTRHDLHALRFFWESSVYILALTAAGGPGPSLRIGAVALIVCYATLLAIGGPVRAPFLGPLDRTASLAALERTAGVLTSLETRSENLRRARLTLRERYKITPELQRELGDRSTLTDPGKIGALWAAGTPTWRPLPVLLMLTSYTDELDRLSAESIAERPRQILRDRVYGGADGRYPVWQSPSYQLQVYCGYDLAMQTPRWQVLRPAQDRCSAPEAGASLDVDGGEVASVPYRPGEMTLVTIEPHFSLVDRIRSLLFKPDPIHVSYGGERWRYAHGSVARRLMLNAPVPHAAYPDQPLTPWESISLDIPASLLFEHVAVDPTTPTEEGPAAPLAAHPRAPRIDFSNELAVIASDEACLVTRPEGDHPFIGMQVPDGSSLLVHSREPGPIRVFLEVDGSYSREQSLRIISASTPFQVYVAGVTPHGRSHIRVDPPTDGATTICLVPV